MSGRIAQKTVDEVRSRADLAELAGAHTQLRQSGPEWVGRCPFHSERTGSFWVNPGKGTFYCFGCQASGDAIGFVERTQALTFPEALEWLADRYGVEVEREDVDPRDAERRAREDRLRALLEQSAVFYRRYLADAPGGGAARSYVDERQIPAEVADRFRLGLAPDAWDRVTQAALKQGVSEDDLVAAGLARRARGGQQSLIDLFRGRLMFPLCDIRGRVVGFGARRLPPDETGPKYLNSPDGPLWHKGSVLYGLHLAKDAIAKGNRAIVVEGYTDVIALHAAGITGVVASMGTSLTDEQVRDLRRLTRNVVLCFDADNAGTEAALRGMATARRAGLEVRVATLPEGSDPADLVTDGPDALLAAVDGAGSVFAFRVRSTLARADLSSSTGRDAALAELAPVFSSEPPSIEHADSVAEAASRLRLPASDLERRLAPRARRRQGRNGAVQETPPPDDPALRDERMLLALCLADESREHAGRAVLEALDERSLIEPEHRLLRELVLRRLRDEPAAPGDDELAARHEPWLAALAAREAGGEEALRELAARVTAHGLDVRVEGLKQRLATADMTADEQRELADLQRALQAARETARRAPPTT